MAPRPPIYSRQDLEGLRAAGKFNARLMDYLRTYVQPGISTAKLDDLAREFTLDHSHTPACLGYKGYPRTICTSVNDVVCHGIPNEIPLQEGDIVNVDVTTIVDGWYGDQSETFLIGRVSELARNLTQVTFDSLYAGIRAIKPHGRIYDIGRAIYDLASKHDFSVVREYQGHGIGREFHQEPGIPHFPHSKMLLDTIEPGMCFTIEPMLNAGSWETYRDQADGWTVRTIDRSLSAQFEHTIFMGEDGPEILTLTEHGPKPGHRF